MGLLLTHLRPGGAVVLTGYSSKGHISTTLPTLTSVAMPAESSLPSSSNAPRTVLRLPLALWLRSSHYLLQHLPMLSGGGVF